MGKQDKELLNNINKHDGFNPDDYQGRSKHQIEGNEIAAMVSVLGFIALTIIIAIIQYI
tara:strand:+ start:568 stop:744 length:177 start_codon:yes stop_codon:yes gene_type:complete